ncbi:uncharacterized protein [Nicotiana tomentosiformis]|uniref:uncharacterized protein n=1 Tax=Nicotiana tomentosiformis TaxID=4098 RepID=UPI00388C5064
MRFSELSRHALMTIPIDAERVQRFVAGLHTGIQATMAREVEMGTSYELVINIARRIEGVCQHGRDQATRDKRFRYSIEFKGAPAGGKGQFVRVQSSRPTYPTSPPPRGAPMRPYFSAMPESSYSPPIIQGSSSGYSGHQGQTSSQQPTVPRGCFECGDLSHVRRFYPRLQGKAVQQGQQPMITVPTAPPAVRPPRGGEQVGRGHPRGGDQSGVHYKSLGIPVYVSTHVGDFVIVDRIYRSCIVTFCSYETRADLLLLDMTDFEVILSIGWLSPYHAILDCHAKDVTLAMLELPRLKWKDLFVRASKRVISFLKARHIVKKGCLAYLAYVRDTTAETPVIDSVPVVWKFSDVFPSDLPGMPPDRDIDFAPLTRLTQKVLRFDGTMIVR